MGYFLTKLKIHLSHFSVNSYCLHASHQHTWLSCVQQLTAFCMGKCTLTPGFLYTHSHKFSTKRTFKQPKTRHSLEKSDSLSETSCETSILKTVFLSFLIYQTAHLLHPQHNLHNYLQSIQNYSPLSVRILVLPYATDFQGKFK